LPETDDDLDLFVAQPDACALAIRHRRRPFEHAVRAGPHLSRRELHALLQRLGELEEQFFERDRARHARTEGLQRLVGRAPVAVDPPVREVFEPIPGGNEQQRGGGRREHRQAEHAPTLVARRLAEAQHDDDVHRHDEHDESAGFDRSHE
jgi:hypothetical protein